MKSANSQKKMREDKESDHINNVIELNRLVTLKDVMEVLKMDDSSKLIIDGIEVVDPRFVYQRLKIYLVELAESFPVDMNEIYFKNFAGKVVGESNRDGVVIDATMLMHPALRLTMAHELAHAKNKVINEGLVELYVESLYGKEGAVLTEKYEEYVNRFKQFVREFDESKSNDENVKIIYALYYNGRFREIYEQWGGDLEVFLKVFPELNYSEG